MAVDMAVVGVAGMAVPGIGTAVPGMAVDMAVVALAGMAVAVIGTAAAGMVKVVVGIIMVMVAAGELDPR
jgi:hypothetical protein